MLFSSLTLRLLLPTLVVLVAFTSSSSNTLVFAAATSSSDNDEHDQHQKDRYLRGGGGGGTDHGDGHSRSRRHVNERVAATVAGPELRKRVIVTYEPGHREGCLDGIRRVAPSLVTEEEFLPQNAFVVMGTPNDVDLLQVLAKAKNASSFVVEVEEDVPRYPMRLFEHNHHHDEPQQQQQQQERQELLQWTSASSKRSSSVAAASSVVGTSMLADDLPYGLGLVQAPELWQRGIRGQGVTVCVIDSGIDSTHEDLTGDVAGYAGQSNLPWDEDTNGHGTHVAGTIAARANDIGVVGVAPDASIYVVRVFGDGGDFLFSSGLVAAVNRCVDAGATIVNLSLGGPLLSRFENRAFANFLSQGVIPVAAAGNDGTTDFSYPASYSGVLSVAAVGADKNLAYFSQRNSMVDIAAPGVSVRSTLPMSSPCDVCNEIGSLRYGSLSGTSMACPHVAGVAALLRSFQPTASALEIEQAIINSAQDVGSSGRDDAFGFGLVQGLAAAELLNGGALEDGANDGNTDGDPTTTTTTTVQPTPPFTPTTTTNPPPTDPSCDTGRLLFRLDLTTDRFGADTSWRLRRLSDDAFISESNYGNEESYVEYVCLQTSECYSFTIFDSGNDGLCCSSGQGSYTVTYGGDVVKRGGVFSSAEEVSIGSCGRSDVNANPVSGTCEQGLVPIDVFLRTDSLAFATSLRLTDDNGNVLKFASGLQSNTNYGHTECVSPEKCYNLTVFDRFSDGLTSGTDGIVIVSFDGVEQDRATVFGSELTVQMGNGCNE